MAVTSHPAEDDLSNQVCDCSGGTFSAAQSQSSTPRSAASFTPTSAVVTSQTTWFHHEVAAGGYSNGDRKSQDVAKRSPPSATASTAASVAGRSFCSADSATPEPSANERQATRQIGEHVSQQGNGSTTVELPYSIDDLAMAECFFEFAGLKDINSVVLKLLLRVVLFLRSCDYHQEDICLVLACASMYFGDVFKSCDKLRPTEAGNIMVLLLFMAHSYMLDETCPLKFWHFHLLSGYCNVRSCNAAIMNIMKLRGYNMRVQELELQRRVHRFAACGLKSVHE